MGPESGENQSSSTLRNKQLMDKPTSTTLPSDTVRPAAGSPSLLGVGLATLLVVVVAFAFRLPACAESFWLDELHSAWAVDGEFSQIASRAAVGNQTSGYFHLLWAWAAVVGHGEVALRMLSVLASCLASALLVIGVAWRSRSTWGGLIAGAVLAIDPNGIFFGCELRPYAFVMLYAVLAVGAMMIWLGDGTPLLEGGKGAAPSSYGGASYGGARWRLAMLFWICVAALVHPTSLGVLSLLIPIAFFVAWKLGRLRLWRADAVAAVVVIATLGALAMSSLPESWQRRDLWRAFGQASDWRQLWYAWSWPSMVLLPMVIACFGWAATRWLGSADIQRADEFVLRRGRWIGLIPGWVGVGGTVLFFCASYYQWVPLWHRRYFVAALPLLAWTAGELGAIAMEGLMRMVAAGGKAARGQAFDFNKVLRPVSFVCGLTVAGLLIGVMLWQQGTLARLARWELPAQFRGETWREATTLVRQRMGEGDLVWLDSGLIEAEFLRDQVDRAEELTELQWEYLQFPLRGPYPLPSVQVVSCVEHESWTRRRLNGLPSRPVTVWLISRSGQSSTLRFVDSLKRIRGLSSSVADTRRPAVVRLDFVRFGTQR